MAGTHAKYSPSGASGWTRCADWASDPTGSKYANWGTAAHEIAARALENSKAAVEYKGLTLVIDGDDYLVDDDMVECVQEYIDIIRNLGGVLLVEQRMPISHLTGEEGAGGTADAVIFKGNEMIVADLKTGMGVRVDADMNEQLLMYGHAAMTMFEPVAEFDTVRLMIIQPRIGHVSEFAISVEALTEWGLRLKIATTVVPGDKQCRWCARKATCETLNAYVTSTVESCEDVNALEASQLAGALKAVDLVETWCKAVRAEAERRLLDGQSVPGFKLVEGKKGSRAWDKADDIEALLKTMKLTVEQRYDMKLISPTSAEKLHKSGAIGPHQWEKLQAHITQKSGSPSVAPASDKRPAISTAVSPEEFQPVTA
jgi:hypothetical protein